jgi:hypothetical protein
MTTDDKQKVRISFFIGMDRILAQQIPLLRRRRWRVKISTSRVVVASFRVILLKIIPGYLTALHHELNSLYLADVSDRISGVRANCYSQGKETARDGFAQLQVEEIRKF